MVNYVAFAMLLSVTRKSKLVRMVKEKGSLMVKSTNFCRSILFQVRQRGLESKVKILN